MEKQLIFLKRRLFRCLHYTNNCLYYYILFKHSLCTLLNFSSNMNDKLKMIKIYSFIERGIFVSMLKVGREGYVVGILLSYGVC